MTPSDIKNRQRLGLITEAMAESQLLMYFDTWIRTLREIRDLPEVSTVATAALSSTTSQQQRTQQSSRGVPEASAPQRSQHPASRRVRRFQSGSWALVQVFDGGVLALFDTETRAREAMVGADPAEVVLLHVGG